MTTTRLAALALAFFFAITTGAAARGAQQRFDNDGRWLASGAGAQNLAQNVKKGGRVGTRRGGAAPALATIRSRKTGATALVSAKYQAAFQGYVDDVESRGASIRLMTGWHKTRTLCDRPRHKHGCGEALDVCQTGRGRILRDCHLPAARDLASIARGRELQEGGEWCHSDLGHVEAGPSVGSCAQRRARKGAR